MEQIIQSRLDNDFYNFTMGQLVWKHYPNTSVKYRFINRGESIDVSLIDEIQEQIAAARDLMLSFDEFDYLDGLGIFSDSYLEFLFHCELPKVDCFVENEQIVIEYEGPWKSTIFWETPLLSIVSEIVSKFKLTLDDELTFVQRLYDKSLFLSKAPGLKFMEFGSRRRLSRHHQDTVLDFFIKYNEHNLLGTSNVMFAQQYGLKPLGTMAHQLFMVTAALWKGWQFSSTEDSANWLLGSQKQVIKQFETMYSEFPELLIYLPDTFGTSTGLAAFDNPTLWRGMRQDSGNAYDVVDKMISWYKSKNIDPASKLIIPSDGLDMHKAYDLYGDFKGECQMAFGIGTNLTNDSRVSAPNIVIKPVAVNGLPCVKLSDTEGKITGDSVEAQAYQKAALDILNVSV